MYILRFRDKSRLRTTLVAARIKMLLSSSEAFLTAMLSTRSDWIRMSNALLLTSRSSSSKAAAKARIIRPISRPTMAVMSKGFRTFQNYTKIKQAKHADIPSLAFNRGRRLDKKLREVPRAEGEVNIVSHTFWRKNDGETVPDRRSRRPRTFSKNSPVSSSRPGSNARMKDFMTGRKPD